MPATKAQQAQMIYASGGRIKATGDGGFEGYLVIFSDADTPDLEGDFFTKETDFDFQGQEVKQTTLYYHHGLDPTFGKATIGTAELSMDDVGIKIQGSLKLDENDVQVWEEAQRKRRDDYLASLKSMLADDVFGLSSGTAPHLVVRERVKASTMRKPPAGHIKKWPLGLDASFTPTPAEPNTSVVATKGLPPIKTFDELVEERRGGGEVKKEQFIDDITSLVYDAFRVEFDPDWMRSAWVMNIAMTLDYVIAYLDDGYFRIPMKIDGSEVTFGTDEEFQAVERVVEWVDRKAYYKWFDGAAEKATSTPSVETTVDIETTLSEALESVPKHVTHFHFDSAAAGAQIQEQVAAALAGSSDTADVLVAEPEEEPEEKAEEVEEPAQEEEPAETDSRRDVSGTLLGDGEMAASEETTKTLTAPASKAGGDGEGIVSVHDLNEMKAEIDAFKQERKEVRTLKAKYDANLNLKTKLGDDETKAIAHFYRTGDKGALGNALKASNDTDMNIGTAADGGNAVPTGHYDRIIAKRAEKSLYPQLGVVDIPGKGTTVDVPTDNEGIDDGEFVVTTEGADDDRDAPAIGQVSMTLLAYTKFIEMTPELMQDEDSKLLAFVEEWVGHRAARTENTLLLTEVAANGATIKTFANITGLVVADIEDMFYGVDDEYGEDEDFKWVMRRATEGKARGIQGTDFLYSQNPQGGGRFIKGARVYGSRSAATIAANAKSIYFGNWAFVGRRDSGDIQFLLDPYSNYPHVRFRYMFRTVYKVLQSVAIGFGVHPAS